MSFLMRWFSSLVGRTLLLGAASALGLTTLWPATSTSPPTPAVEGASTDLGRVDVILLALEQTLRSVQDYVATGGPEGRAAFQRRMTRLEELLALLETNGAAERRAAAGSAATSRRSARSAPRCSRCRTPWPTLPSRPTSPGSRRSGARRPPRSNRTGGSSWRRRARRPRAGPRGRSRAPGSRLWG